MDTHHPDMTAQAEALRREISQDAAQKMLAALVRARMDMQSVCCIRPDWHQARFTLEAINAAIAAAEGR